MTQQVLEPIRRSILVSWSADAAFRRFTAEFDSWWPRATHSVGRGRVRRVVFEGRVDGRIYEEHVGGRRFQWGRVTAWEPPGRVAFTWHPSRDPATAQDVEVRFLVHEGGTRVELTSSGWERWGKDVAKAHRGYDVGWGYVLNVWAGRRTVRMMLLGVAAHAVLAVRSLRGGVEASIAKAAGEIEPAGRLE